MPKYEVNHKAVAHARRLIDSGNYVIRSRWEEVNPSASEQNSFLKSHSWAEYGAWHLGAKIGTNPETKGHFGFGFGDLRRVHRSALIACQFRAAEFEHKSIELAAHRLLQRLDKKKSR
jgi:hypothetical protein